MESLRYTKISGTGNTFLILDLRSKENQAELSRFYKAKEKSEISQMLCKAFEVDGLLFVLSPKGKASLDFEVDFYNQDGSRAEMCGNGASSLAYFAYKNKEHFSFKREFIFKFLLGQVVTAKIVKNFYFLDESIEKTSEEKSSDFKFMEEGELKNGDYVELQCFPATVIEWDQKTEIFKNKMNFHLIQSGVPHAVFEYPYEWNEDHLIKVSKFLRKKKKFSKEKTNITYFKTVERNSIRAVSFERGVETLTKACGTGALAAGFCYYKKNPFCSTVLIHMPGGKLNLNFESKSPLLRSKVKILEEGILGSALKKMSSLKKESLYN